MPTLLNLGPYWSFSRLKSYLSCSQSYFFRYISGEEPASKSSNLVLGAAVHYGHELIYRGMKAGTIPPLGDVLDEVSENILIQAQLNPPILFPNGGDINTLVEEARRLTECLHGSVVPEKVVAVDLEETVPLLDYGEPLPLPLKVVYDLVVESEGEEVVVDLKTSRTRYQQSQLTWALQPTCYLYARRVSGGNGIQRSFRYDCILKKANPELVRYPVTRDQADFQRMAATVKMVERGVQNGVFIPNRESYFCASCEWEKICRDWKG